MASKQVHICDRCESYASVVYTITFSFSKNNTYIDPMTGARSISSQNQIQREICPECSKDIFRSLKGGKDVAAIERELFDQFELPKKEPPQTP